MTAETKLKMLARNEKPKMKNIRLILFHILRPHSVLPEWKGKEKEFLDEQLNHVMPIV